MPGTLTITVGTGCLATLDSKSLSSGTISFLATDAKDSPIAVAIVGTSQFMAEEIRRQIDAGAMTGDPVVVPDPASSSPQNYRLRITIVNLTTKKTTVYRNVAFANAGDGTWDLKTMNAGLYTEVPQVVGSTGLSAYAIAVQNGFEGSEQDWLDSLKGEGVGDLAETLSVDHLQVVGRTSDPVDQGSSAATNAYLFLDTAAQAGVLASIKLYAKATGTITLARYTLSGSTYTRTAFSAGIAIGATGLVTLTASDYGDDFAQIQAGEYLAFQTTPALIAYNNASTADGSGYAMIASSSLPTTASGTNLPATVRFEMQCNLAYSVQVVTGDDYLATKAVAYAQADVVSSLSETLSQTVSSLSDTLSQTVGRTSDPVTQSGTAATATYLWRNAVTNAGTLVSVKLFVKATGTIQLGRYTFDGTTYTRTALSPTITLAATGLVTLTASDYGADFASVAAGEYFAYRTSVASIAYNNATPTDGSGIAQLTGAMPTTSSTNTNLPTSSRIEGQWIVEYDEQVVTAASFEAMQGQINALVPKNNGTLTLSNVDKIVIVSNSFNEAAATLLGKSPCAITSALSEYNWGNFSLGGRGMPELATLVSGGSSLFGATFAAHKPTYALLCENRNSKSPSGDNLSDAAYYAATQHLIDCVRAQGASPILMSEWGMGITNGYTITTDGEQANMKGMQAIALANGIPFIDGTSKSRTFNPSMYAAFFKTMHPGTRMSYLVTDAMRKVHNLIPSPVQSMKIFRTRATVTVSSVADLVFTTIQERHRLFREIYIGQMALSDAGAGTYDTATALYADDQTKNDEYIALNAGTATALGSYALVDCVLPYANAAGVTVTLSDTTITVYALKKTNTGASWVALTLSNGVYVVPDNSGLVCYDRLSLLLYKSGGASLNASPSVTWTSGTTKQRRIYPMSHGALGAEMLTQPLTSVAGAVPAAWTNTGALPSVVPTDGAAYLPGENQTPPLTTGCVEVTSSSGISQPLGYTSSDDAVDVVVRVWARRWVAIFDSANDFSTAPVTYETCDTATLQVTLCGASGVANASAVLKEQVGLAWTEVEFRASLPVYTTATTVDVRSGDYAIQIAKVSVRPVQ